MRIRLVVVSVAVFGCVAKTENVADTTAAVASSTAAADTQVRVTGTGIDASSPPSLPAFDSVALRASGTAPPISSGTSFTISPNGFGPLRVGMTVAQAARAMGGGIGAPQGYDGGCGYAVLVKAPRGLAIMLQDGKIARFEVRSGGIATAAGARIGDSESRIKSLYGSAVTSSPHKYVQGGHYLTVTPPTPADAAYKTIFETDGKKVTEFRAGKSPEVEQVERCG